jgi:sec-independent protein translocase protein TatB
VFNLTGSELVVILLLALVVLGPEKLPDAIRRFGKAYSELKKMGTGFQQEFKAAMDEPMREMRESADMLRKSADFSGEQTSSASPPSRSTPERSTAVRAADDPPHPDPTDEVPFGEPPSDPDPETDHR